jgi:hypothetical protein
MKKPRVSQAAASARGCCVMTGLTRAGKSDTSDVEENPRPDRRGVTQRFRRFVEFGFRNAGRSRPSDLAGQHFQFQLAEVAVTRNLFAAILHRIARLAIPPPVVRIGFRLNPYGKCRLTRSSMSEG